MNAGFRRSLSIRRSVAAAVAALALVPIASVAQAPANQTIPWSTVFKPVVLGDGVQVASNQISVLNAGVDGTKYKWQNKAANVVLLDYSDISSVLKYLHVNAWAEYDGFVASGQISFDYNSYNAYNGNTRTWEVDAVRSWTAMIPKPQLTAQAISYQGSPSQFQNLYGNYAVTGIVYRREIKILFQETFTSTVSSTQWSAAINGSSGFFSGGVSASVEQANLEACGQVTITASVTGGPSAGILASGSSGDLSAIQMAVQNQLAQWDTAPTDPNDAGTVDSVYLTTYNAVTPPAPVPPQMSPNQIILTNALAKLIQLLKAQQRLADIASNDTNLNPKLIAYLFGINDATGNHIPGTGKADEVQNDITKQTAYYKSLHDNDGLVSDPKIVFSFKDPDVVQWRVVEYIAGSPNEYYPIIEIYSNARVKPYAPIVNGGFSGTDYWSAGLRTIQTTQNDIQGVYNALTYPWIPLSNTYTADLDPATGIPHRFVALQWACGPGPMRINLVGESDQSQNFYNATDWDGVPAPQILIEPSSWRRVDGFGAFLNRLLGGAP